MNSEREGKRELEKEKIENSFLRSQVESSLIN